MTIKLINPLDWILRIAIRMAHRRWNDRNRIPDGIPGIRDIVNPCDCYSPKKSPVALAKFAHGCRGDGHYLCHECAWLTTDEGEESNYVLDRRRRVAGKGEGK